MDPFSAIGLAGNIVTFLDLGYKLLSESKTIYKSASGTSERNDELALVARQLRDFASSLRESSRGSTKDQEVALHKLASECSSTSLDLLRLLDSLKARNPKSVRGSLIAAFRDWRKKDEKEGLRLKLDCHRDQLNLQIAALTRAESLDRLNKLITYGKASGDELRSLTKNIESLRSGSNVSCLSSDALHQIRSLLGLTEEAVLKIRQARILGGLRFVSMTERFEDIEEAHERTFHWLLETGQGKNEEEVGNETESAKNSAAHDDLGEGDDIGETEVADHRDPNNDISVINRNNDPNDDDNSSFDWSTNSCDISDSETSEALSEGEISRGDSQSFTRKSKSDPISDRVLGPLRQVMMEQGNGIFHISGKAGSGKTIEHLRGWAGDKELVIGRFFFWKPGSTLQKSFKGLLIPIAFPEQWEASLYTESIHIEHHESFQKYKFALFIDGLDEFEGEHANLVRMLFDWVNNTQSVKICVSSREWTVFHEMFRHCPKIRLHYLTYSDVRLVVQSRLRKMSTLYLADPEEEIVVRSEGVFLWVVLVVRHIEEGLENGDQVGDLIKVLKTLPTDLEHMFRQLLDSISPSHRKLAYTMLNFALSLHQRHITTRLMQYAFLDDYIKDKNFAVGKPIRMFSAAENAQRLDKGRKQVYGVCKGFLELRPQIYSTRPRVLEIVNLLGDAVFFTHRSIVEFLESRNFKEMAEPVLKGFEPLDAYYYTYLGVLRHVNLPSFYFTPKLKVLGFWEGT
ncbi:hypothetical protein F5Y04DRAFT_270296 [Hypomontagnella monticulosa]|nr:hypothetical protein F5Y04DRAFT_270296 [Hypomontagnella monticulosa]